MDDRKKIIQLLKSKDPQYWLTAIMVHKQGGFTAEDAWRWFVFGLFASAGFHDAGNCYARFSYLKKGAILNFGFSTIKVKIIIKQFIDQKGVESHVYDNAITFDGSKQIKTTWTLHENEYIKLKRFIPEIKPYSSYDWIEGERASGQAYFYGLLCFILEPHKQEIMKYLHIN